MKKRIVLLLVFCMLSGFVLQACSSREKCPAYSTTGTPKNPKRMY